MRHGQVVAGVNASPRYDTHLEENAEAWGDKDPGLQPLEKAAWREWDLILVAGWRKGSLPGGNEGHSQRRRSIKGPPSLLPVTIGSDSHALLCNNKPTVIQTTRRVSCHEPEPFPGPPSSQLSFLSYVFQ